MLVLTGNDAGCDPFTIPKYDQTACFSQGPLNIRRNLALLEEASLRYQ